MRYPLAFPKSHDLINWLIYTRDPLVADIDDLHECSSCCRYRGSYMSVPIVADIEDLT